MANRRQTFHSFKKDNLRTDGDILQEYILVKIEYKNNLSKFIRQTTQSFISELTIRVIVE